MVERLAKRIVSFLKIVTKRKRQIEFKRSRSKRKNKNCLKVFATSFFFRAFEFKNYGRLQKKLKKFHVSSYRQWLFVMLLLENKIKGRVCVRVCMRVSVSVHACVCDCVCECVCVRVRESKREDFSDYEKDRKGGSLIKSMILYVQ